MMHTEIPEKTFITYELVILQTLNFHIRPPFELVIKHMHSILTIVGKSLEDVLDKESYANFIE